MIKGGKKLLNPLVAAQNFEYKMSNILGVCNCSFSESALNTHNQTNLLKACSAMSPCCLVHSVHIDTGSSHL